jgi:uracil-DNA glycosylase
LLTKDKIEKIEAINKRIFECRKCDFHKELKEKEIAYYPDAPVENFENRNINIITVGINSTWNDNAWDSWKECYKLKDYEKYKEYCMERYKKDPDSKYSKSYSRGIASATKEINKHLNIVPGNYFKEIKEAEIFNEYVLWQNLSFCNSNSPNDSERKIGGKPVPCRVYSEEIPNCLEKEYLKDVISIINPELVVFFAIEVLDYIYYKKLIKLLFYLDNHDEINDFGGVKSFMRNKTSSTRGLACKINNKKNTKILFLPHPSCYRYMKKEKLIKMIEILCEKLK